MPAHVPLAQRFWYKVDPDPASGCWNWTGHRDKNGYARVNVNRVNTPAHRVAYALCRGDIPATMGGKRTNVMHHCDNPACVNPWHLSVATPHENMHDMIRKGRARHPIMRPDPDKCRSGRHAWVPENIYSRQRTDRTGNVDRTCRLCARERTVR